MYFALDTDGNRINALDADKNHMYFCPVCGSEMLLKIGQIKAAHFAHRDRKECDPWYTNNKGEWHREMQSLFLPEQQEYPISFRGKTHIADVYLPGGRVIEFQHSSMTGEEFRERSLYYSIATRMQQNLYIEREKANLIWVFDCVEKHIYSSYSVTDKKFHIVWDWKSKLFEQLDEHFYVYHKSVQGREKPLRIPKITVFLRVRFTHWSHELNQHDPRCGKIGYIQLWHPWSTSKSLYGKWYWEDQFKEELRKMSLKANILRRIK